MSNQIDQHAERGLPFNTDWEEASLMGSLPTGLVHCFLRLTVPNIKQLLPGRPCMLVWACLLVDSSTCHDMLEWVLSIALSPLANIGSVHCKIITVAELSRYSFLHFVPLQLNNGMHLQCAESARGMSHAYTHITA